MTKDCFECGKPATEEHHVIPQSMGGTKTVPLCGGCHDLVHGWGNKRRDNHVELTKIGLQKAKDRGVKLGFSNPLNEGVQEVATSLAGLKKREIADTFAASVASLILPLAIVEKTLSCVAGILNDKSIPTFRGGCKWYPASVKNVLTRLGVDDFQNKEEIQKVLDSMEATT